MTNVAGAEREDDGQAAKIAATFSSAASLILSFSASLQPLQLQQQPLCLSAAAAAHQQGGLGAGGWLRLFVATLNFSTIQTKHGSRTITAREYMGALQRDDSKMAFL